MAWRIQDYLLIIVVLILVIWYLNLIWKKRNHYYYSWNVPGPLALPIIGSAYFLLRNPTDILDTVFKIINKYPSPMKFWIGSKLIYTIGEPQHVEKLLTSQKCLEKDEFYKFVRHTIGNGLLTAPVNIWRRHRKLILPSFNQKVLDQFVDTFSEQSIIFTEVIKKHVGKTDIDITENITAFTMDAVCESAMGLKLNTQKKENVFAKHLEAAMEITTLRVYWLWQHLGFPWKLYPLSRVLKKHVDGFHSVTSTVIKKKLEVLQQLKAHEEDSIDDQIEEDGNKKRLAFLDLLLEHGKFTEQELMEEVEIFLCAGTDTTGITIYFLFEMLGIYPAVQQKVYEEVMDILGENRSVEPSDIPNFKYLERVINETMRLFPAGPYIARTVGENIKLGKYTIPEGAAVVFSTLNIHRNPMYWPNPMKFDPDRFLPEEVAKRPPCCFIPFSFGPRNCIGSKYAMMMMKTIAATTIRKYKLFSMYGSAEEIKVIFKLLLRAKHPSKVYFEHR